MHTCLHELGDHEKMEPTVCVFMCPCVHVYDLGVFEENNQLCVCMCLSMCVSMSTCE